MAGKTRLQILQTEEAEETVAQNQTSDAAERGLGLLLTATMVALNVLNKRAINALGHAIPLLALGIGLFLWMRVMENPNIYQLTGLGIYSAFALALIWIRR